MYKLLAAIAVQITAFQVQATVIHWAGQLPPEQFGPVVEYFNDNHSADYGFTVEYKYDEKAIADHLNGVSGTYDLVHMKDADMLNTAALKKSTQALSLEDVKAWPAQMKDSENRWVALLKRARIIYYDSTQVTAEEAASYEALGAEKFKDKLCLRQKKAQYTIGLHSYFVGVWGEAKTAQVLKSWAVNSENIPLIEKDLDGVIAGIENGTCLVGVANTYYYSRHLVASPNTKVKPVIPNHGDISAHVNIDGVALSASSAHKTEVNAFVRWLLSEEAQLMMSNITGKHPANPSVRSASLDAIFGRFQENTTFDLNRITDLKAKAQEIATEQGLK